jgi:hypothetical protein
MRLGTLVGGRAGEKVVRAAGMGKASWEGNA